MCVSYIFFSVWHTQTHTFRTGCERNAGVPAVTARWTVNERADVSAQVTVEAGIAGPTGRRQVVFSAIETCKLEQRKKF